MYLVPLLTGCLTSDAYDQIKQEGYDDGYLAGEAAAKAEYEEELAGVMKRLDALEAGQLVQDDSLTTLDQRLDGVEAGQSVQDGRLDTLEAGQSVQDGRLDGAERDISDLQTNDPLQDQAITDLQNNDTLQDQAITDLQRNDTLQDIGVAALQSNDALQDSNIVALQGNDALQNSNIAALQSNDALQDSSIASLQSDVSDLEANALRIVRMDETWVVDASGAGDYSTVEAAVEALDGVVINADVTVTIQIEPGTYGMTNDLYIDSPWASQVRIQGDTTDPSQVVLEFPGSGIWLDGGVSLGYLGELTLRTTNSGVAVGLEVRENSEVVIGSLDIDGFYYGIDAAWGGRVTSTDSSNIVRIVGSTYGANANGGAAIEIYNLEASGPGQGDGCGLTAGSGSVLVAIRATVDAFFSCATATKGSTMEVESLSASNCYQGVDADSNSTVAATYATITGAGLYGMYAVDNSSISADFSNVTGSGTWDYFADTNAVIKHFYSTGSSTGTSSGDGVLNGP